MYYNIYILLCIVLDLLKKYYHHLLANMVPETARSIKKTFFYKINSWVDVDVDSLSNKQFLDLLIMKTESNFKLFKFCNVITLFMDNSNQKNVTTAFKNG